MPALNRYQQFVAERYPTTAPRGAGGEDPNAHAAAVMAATAGDPVLAQLMASLADGECGSVDDAARAVRAAADAVESRAAKLLALVGELRTINAEIWRLPDLPGDTELT